MSRPRWDPDERGRGVADASEWLPVLAELTELSGRPDWVAEQPEHHLLPHLRTAIDASPGSVTLRDWSVRPDGVLVVDVEVTSEDGDKRGLRTAGFTLLGSIAESATAIHERSANGRALELDVVTGMLDADTEFATHGHTVRLRIRATNSP